MRVLVGCEFSGTVRNAFSDKGHTAWSCDLIESDDNSMFHMVCDVMDALKAGYDLAILHPPCTCLCVSGNSTYGTDMPKNSMRMEAIEWTHMLWNTAKKYCNKVCLENPVGVLNSKPGMPKPNYVQPWMFGHPESKKTGLWWVLISNAVLVALSLGLAIPWARIRAARYKLSHVGLWIDGDLEEFLAAEVAQSSALGEELGEAFDLDIGL